MAMIENLFKPKTSGVLIAAVVALALLNTPSFAVDLNAPVTTKKPTVKNEIIRGYHAINTYCSSKGRDTINYFDCSKTIIEENRQRYTDTEPFLLGANLCMFSYYYYPTVGDDSFQYKMSVSIFRDLKILQNTTGIDNKQLVEVLKSDANMEIIMKKIQEYEAKGSAK